MHGLVFHTGVYGACAQVALPAAMSSPSFASDRALVRLVTDMTEAMEERGL